METTTEQPITKPAAAMQQTVEQSKFVNLNMPVGAIDNKWAAYDLFTAPVQYLDAQGNPKPTRYKAVFKSDRLVTLASQKYQLFPNEVALELTDQLARNAGFETHKAYYSKDSNYVCATYLNEAKFTFNIAGAEAPKQAVEGDIKAGATRLEDVVSVGFTMRNSIDGTSAFSFAGKGGAGSSFSFGLFTYRKVCSNGAMAWRQSTGMTEDRKARAQGIAVKATIRHIGKDTEAFERTATAALQSLQPQMNALVKQYRSWYYDFLSESVAQKIAKHIPARYLPDYIKLQDGKVDIQATGTKWEAFNAMTDKIWHAEKLGIKAKADYSSRLHEILGMPETAQEAAARQAAPV